MPEGDTIHRTAARLKPALVGQTLRSFRAPRLGGDLPGPGTVVDDVEARGKYLLIHFRDGPTLETHMKMSGSWHLYRVGERWRKPARAARVILETEQGWQAVCFSAPHARLLPRKRRGPQGAGRRYGGPGHLGPDLCVEDVDRSEAVRRFVLVAGDTPIADALLDQRVCCGVGNVYKSEVLFVERIDPLTPTDAVSEKQREAVVDTAHRLLRQNLSGGPRVTTVGGSSATHAAARAWPVGTGGPRLAVYGRRDQPCLRCGTAISYAKIGRYARGTYWCPVCQSGRGGSFPQ